MNMLSDIGPFAQPRPTMRGRYLIRNRRKAQAMEMLDRVLTLVPKRSAPPCILPERILVSNWGHLGDVITTFGAISALRRRYPGARIGMIVSSGGRAAIADTGLVDDLYIVDHWIINRSATATPAQKRRQFRESRAKALHAIRAANYQAAIDFYPFFPPAHPLFRAVGIACRIGFDSGGFGPLLTHPVPWQDVAKPMAEHYRRLLQCLDPGFAAPTIDLRPRRDRNTLAPLPEPLNGIGRYIILHPGAGAEYKDWGLAHWRDLAARLQALAPELQLVLTGAGAGEAMMTAELARATPGAIDLAGQAAWESFVSAVAHATLVICPDTATGHVAAMFDTPVVSIFTGTNDPVQWGPYSDHARVLVHPVLCAPCNLAGCAVMACIRATSPETIARAAAAMLEAVPR